MSISEESKSVNDANKITLLQTPYILTPKSSDTHKINGVEIFDISKI